MSKEKAKQQKNAASNNIEDLTLNESEAGTVKGGASDYLLELDGVKGESKDDRHSFYGGYTVKPNSKA